MVSPKPFISANMLLVAVSWRLPPISLMSNIRLSKKSKAAAQEASDVIVFPFRFQKLFSRLVHVFVLQTICFHFFDVWKFSIMLLTLYFSRISISLDSLYFVFIWKKSFCDVICLNNQRNRLIYKKSTTGINTFFCWSWLYSL